MPKLQLQGFNNLTKTLSINLYNVRYASTTEQQKRYIASIDEAYNAKRLTQILDDISRIIGANILNIARQDYEPQGASVAMLLSEEFSASECLSDIESPRPLPETVLCHLDKSHITAHTYPESHPGNDINTFRTDIDVSTCGRISPLKALNSLIRNFAADVAIIDYRVRGFTRDLSGRKHFIDHPIHSIQNYLAKDILERYRMIDVNIHQEHLFHTKMILKSFELNNYLFGIDKQDIPVHEQAEIERRLQQEMAEIFYGENPHQDLQV
ncbi:MAG: adenosylmethionine decarboxylase [Phycisphaerales bacterium]|nr:adenosylmethionine decarboxylase [Phycisphaerales bacterium]